MATVVLLGTMDTKGREYQYIRSVLEALGVESLVVDAGIHQPTGIDPDISRHDVAQTVDLDVTALAAAADRGAAVTGMSRGAARVLERLHKTQRLQGVLALGGTGGTTLATYAMRALPVGVPKLMVSTVASGDTRGYVGATDISMMYSVVDIAGINQLSSTILANAAGAIAGMVGVVSPAVEDRPLIGATMFGVTTPAVEVARTVLEAAAYEVLVFHATGSGGRSMEGLIHDGYITGVLDLTTTELADELVGGVFSAGAHRLEAAADAAIPQVVSLGALDMVNFGPIDSVPTEFRGRQLYKHNETVTLMRTTPSECAKLGRTLAEKVNRAAAPVTVFIPLRGVSAISVEGQVFYDPSADDALFEAVRADCQPHVRVVELDMAINDAAFANAMASELVDLMHGK